MRARALQAAAVSLSCLLGCGDDAGVGTSDVGVPDDPPIVCADERGAFVAASLDSDQDGAPDVAERCPLSPGSSDEEDADNDGLGDACDLCPRRIWDYNKDAVWAGVPPYMLVRNIPSMADADQDGVGDVCDNCVLANCLDYGPDNPHAPDEAIDYEDTSACQQIPADTPDELWRYIGAACFEGGAPVQLPGAAGPVGFYNDDDFDQDGISNLRDLCPRQPVEAVSCDDDVDCEDGRACTEGVCNHVDGDDDNVGDICDTCPFVANIEQLLDGGQQDDDPDFDFVGAPCEPNVECDVPEPRAIAAYDVAARGRCCTVRFDPSAGLTDPEGRRLDTECGGDESCRALPEELLAVPGMVALPPGCEEALLAAGHDPQSGDYATPLTLDSPQIAGDERALLEHLCLLPPPDADFDGLGDACDLCPYAHDPKNTVYVDDNGLRWPDFGAYCADAYCEAT